MIPAQRQAAILSRLDKQTLVTITELTQILNVSHMTIRRDIEKLQKEGLVIAVTGGVQRSNILQAELSHQKKLLQNHPEKMAIGRYAAKQIPTDATIYLDAGTTTLAIAESLIERSDLTIITNDFPIINLLIEHSEATLFHTGGRVDKSNASAIGERAARLLLEFNIDMAFVSTSSFDNRGISTPNERKVAVKRAVMQASKSCKLVTDSSKYGQVATFHVSDLEAFDSVITDKKIPKIFHQVCEEKKVTLVTLD